MPDSDSRQVARAAMFTCPPVRPLRSNSTTSWPRSAETRAASSPAGPAPTTTTRFFLPAFAMMCGMVRSRPVAGFWMQSASPPT